MGLIALVLLGHSLCFCHLRVDDAFILMRYAANLASGHGATFNVGERVEGFTSPAMVAIEALFMAIRFDPLVGAKVVGVLSGLALLWFTFRLSETLTRSFAVAALAAALVAAHTSVAVAMVNGLETAPFAALVLIGLFFHLRREKPLDAARAGLALGAAVLFRPEGMLPLGCVALHMLWRERRQPERWSDWTHFALSASALVVPLTLARVLYFGSLVPNTALAKVPIQLGPRLGSGLAYLAEFAAAHYGYLSLAGLVVAAFRSGADRVFLLGLVGVWSIYLAFTGGDWMPEARFFVPLVPLAAMAAAELLVLLWNALTRLSSASLRRSARASLVLLAAALIVPSEALAFLETRDLVADLTEGSRDGREVLGDCLRRLLRPNASVAMLDVGAVSFRSGLRLLDTGGLTDPRIARILRHSKGTFHAHLFFLDDDGAWQIAQLTLSEQPDAIVLLLNGVYPELSSEWEARKSRGLSNPINVTYRQDLAIYNEPRFKAHYRYLCHVPGDWNARGWRWYYNVFVRADEAAAVGRAKAPIDCTRLEHLER